MYALNVTNMSAHTAVWRIIFATRVSRTQENSVAGGRHGESTGQQQRGAWHLLGISLASPWHRLLLVDLKCLEHPSMWFFQILTETAGERRCGELPARNTYNFIFYCKELPALNALIDFNFSLIFSSTQRVNPTGGQSSANDTWPPLRNVVPDILPTPTERLEEHRLLLVDLKCRNILVMTYNFIFDK